MDTPSFFSFWLATTSTVNSILRNSLLLLAALTLCAPLHAQFNFPGLGGMTSSPAQPEDKPLAEQRKQTEAELEAIRQQLKGLQASDPTDQATGPDQAAMADLEERRRLLNVIMYFKNEKLWRLDELLSLKKSKPPAIGDDPLVKALGTTPPYHVLQVDALRDELDSMKERHHWLQNVLHVWENEKKSLLERLRKSSEAARLASDDAAREKTEEATRRKQIADLYQQVDAAELSARVVDQEFMRAQSDQLQQQIDTVRDFIANIIPQQRLTEDDIDDERAKLRKGKNKLADEIDKITERHAKYLAERHNLVANLAPNQPSPPRMTFVDQALSADSTTLDALRAMQVLQQAQSEAWEHRFVLLLPEKTPDAHRHAREGLQKIDSQLNGVESSWRRMLAVQTDGLRSLIADQEAHVARQEPGSPEASQAREVLSLQRGSLSTYERFSVQVRDLGNLVERWLGDFGMTGKGQSAPDRSTWQTIRQTATSIWNYELFSVEDTTQVDGQKITVSYGVTVGKSIGSILLFIIGYWLLSYLTKRLFRLLTEMGMVNVEQASVIRRWLMITIAFILAVFVLNIARIPLTVFAFVGGALAIGVGFGTQTVIKNFISGIILLFEHKVRVGDIVVIGGITGTVSSVDLRATTVNAFDGVEALIPNSDVLESQVINWTYSNKRLRREIRVQVEYGSSMRDATRIILTCAQEHGQILESPEPEVFFEDFADSGLTIRLVYWIELGANVSGPRIDSDLRFMMEKRLTSAGIGFPFPTRDVNLKAARPLPVTMVEAKDEEESEPEIMFRVENDEEEDNSLALQESPEEPKRAD